MIIYLTTRDHTVPDRLGSAAHAILKIIESPLLYILVWNFWLKSFRDDDTWEPVSNLDCPEIIEAYERAKKAKTNEEKEKQDRIKRESYSRTNPTKEPAKKKSKKVRKYS